MPSSLLRILKAYLWFIAIFHLFVGLAVNMSEPFTKMIAAGYGARVDWTSQFTYILHPLGAFMIILGVLAACAARNPDRYDVVVLGFVILFAIRALQRVLYADVLESAFGISSSRNTLNVVLFAAQAVVLFVLWRGARMEIARAAAAAVA
jgi:hypothetical protein